MQKTDNLSRISHLANIRKLFVSGAKLTVLGVWKLLSTFELRHWVAILRKEGLKITDEWKTSEAGKRYKVYWIQS